MAVPLPALRPEVTVKRLLCITLASLLFQVTLVSGADQGKNKGKKHVAHDTHDRGDGDASLHVHVSFGKADVQMIREHYAPRYRNLPPGLQKHTTLSPNSPISS